MTLLFQPLALVSQGLVIKFWRVESLPYLRKTEQIASESIRQPSTIGKLVFITKSSLKSVVVSKEAKTFPFLDPLAKVS